MRTMKDRVRHTVGFELIGLLLCIPLAVFVFDVHVQQAGGFAVAASIIATVWNFIYNYLVDGLMLRFLKRLTRRWESVYCMRSVSIWGSCWFCSLWRPGG